MIYKIYKMKSYKIVSLILIIIFFFFSAFINTMHKKDYISNNLLFSHVYLKQQTNFNILRNIMIQTSYTNSILLAEKKDIIFYNPEINSYYDKNGDMVANIQIIPKKIIIINNYFIPKHFFKQIWAFIQKYDVYKLSLIDHRRWIAEIQYHGRIKVISFSAKKINIKKLDYLQDKYKILDKLDIIDLRFNNIMLIECKSVL